MGVFMLKSFVSSAKAWVPPFAIDWINLGRIRRRFPQALYINSPGVSSAARLGNHVGIGKDVVINSGVSLGDYSYVNRGAIIFSGSIGKFCSIAHFAQIGPEVHPTDYLSTSPFIYGPKNIVGTATEFEEFPDPPHIGSDVWIGSHAVIMQGVTIGHGAVVGAGAVVTKDVEAYSIVAGVPAKVLRRRFSDRLCQELLELRWWDLPAKEMERIRHLVDEPDSMRMS